MKAFMLAGVSSGIGKTTISMALMSAFDNVSAFKIGPDYIDPGFHEFITGNPSYNLDIFMMGEAGVRYSFYNIIFPEQYLRCDHRLCCQICCPSQTEIGRASCRERV